MSEPLDARRWRLVQDLFVQQEFLFAEMPNDCRHGGAYPYQSGGYAYDGDGRANDCSSRLSPDLLVAWWYRVLESLRA